MTATKTKPMNTTAEIQRLLLLNWDDSRIFHSVGWATPEVFAEEELRQMAAGTSKHVPYDPAAAYRLKNLIKTARREFEAENTRQSRRDATVEEEDGVCLEDVDEVPMIRVPTKWHDLNKMFGSTKLYDATNRVIGEEFGLPLGQIALLGGEEGAGKTRWYTSLVLHLAEDLDMKVGVYQGEMDKGEYKTLLTSICRAMGFTPQRAIRNIYVFKKEHHEGHCQKIKELGLGFFVWDSFPQLARSNTKAGIDDIVLDVKQAMRGQCAGMMVQHLDKATGKIKGNNHISYMSDDVLILRRQEEFGKDVFSIVKEKARSGGRGEKCWYMHSGNGCVMTLPSEKYNLREKVTANVNASKKARKT